MAGALAGGVEGGSRVTPSPMKIRRIATEEAWSFPEHLDALANIGQSLWSNLDAENINAEGSASANRIVRGLLDLDGRVAEMERLGVDMQVLGLTSPGVQMFRTEFAVAMAARANDRLAEVVAANPRRFAGLATFAPQDPRAAAREMERAIRTLHLSGFIINSHTDGGYLDQERFWPILEAANDLGAPIYLHPRCPSDGMAGPFRDHRIQSAIWGFAIETGTHAMRLIVSGVFDRFPRLQFILGHMGENLPFHLWRSDHWFERRAGVYASKRKPSEVMRNHFTITNSGVEHAPALRYAIDVLGRDRVMWAIDCPYEEMAPAVQFLNAANLNDDERRAFFHGNAERTFALPALQASPEKRA
jgi:predicted TIM-barrel fold metal-dependent hydrolase